MCKFRKFFLICQICYKTLGFVGVYQKEGTTKSPPRQKPTKPFILFNFIFYEGTPTPKRLLSLCLLLLMLIKYRYIAPSSFLFCQLIYSLGSVSCHSPPSILLRLIINNFIYNNLVLHNLTSFLINLIFNYVLYLF